MIKDDKKESDVLMCLEQQNFRSGVGWEVDVGGRGILEVWRNELISSNWRR